MNTETTCALVIINKDGDILGCHGTGKPTTNGYDFPKGCYEQSDKYHLMTAVRELKEETGMTLELEDVMKIIDCGTYHHSKNKDIHIFILQVTRMPNISGLKCTSYFKTESGNMYPEVNGYKIIKKEERSKYFYRVLQNKFEIIDQFNKSR